MIHTDKLTRHFVSKSGSKKETVEAVRGVDIDVAPGELVAFLGPNGAGKSTTLRMLTSLLPPTSGTATVAGLSVTQDPAGVRSRIGYIGQGNGAGHSYRVLDELMMQGRFYGLNKADAKARAASLLKSLDLEGHVKRAVSTLSGGQRRRLDIAMGLMHEPTLLFLDEPSTGMDPQNRANLWEHILRMREDHGTTIVLTTHYLEEADTQAERVIVIDHGRIIADDTAAQLKANLAGDQVTVTVAEVDLEKANSIVVDHGREMIIGSDPLGATLSIRVDSGPQTVPVLLRRLDAAGIDTLAATVRQPTLDDVFLSLTGRSLREGGGGRMSTLVGDTRAVFTREMMLVLRDPFSIVFSLVQPLVFLGLFGPLLGGAVGAEAFGGQSSLQWFLPGVIVMITLFGTSAVGSNLQYELMTGSYERVLATPLRRSSLLIGRALKELAPLVVQALLITLISVPFGVRLYPLEMLLGLVILGVFGVGVGALSYSLALATKKREWMFWLVQQTLIFPLLILSGMMLPLEQGPGWMQVAAKFNPLTYIVNAERALFTGNPGDVTVLLGMVAAALTCLVGLLVGIRLIKRSTS